MVVAPSPGGDDGFNSFLERQQAHLQRKRVAEAKRAEAQEAELNATRTVGRRLSADTDTESTPAPPSARSSRGPSFLDRVAEASRRKSEQLSSRGERGLAPHPPRCHATPPPSHPPRPYDDTRGR